ncbi:protein of unknown function [Paenibacillus alvei]|uniref:Uncharacterized protein n=1 Tax=Paenibacillus alvei TaxID=44250 RepID=A0A383RAT2_PAEAL|nr:protein of unknown function [Paenibacillus alvei]
MHGYDGFAGSFGLVISRAAKNVGSPAGQGQGTAKTAHYAAVKEAGGIRYVICSTTIMAASSA